MGQEEAEARAAGGAGAGVLDGFAQGKVREPPGEAHSKRAQPT